MNPKLLAATLTIGLVTAWGCAGSGPRKNPRELSHGEDGRNYEALRGALIRNGLKSDMGLADLHFVGGSAKLNGLGVHRLQQYAEILAVDGGTLRVETRAPDTELTQQRLTSVMEYLASAGVARDRIEVVPGLRGGRGMAAAEAIQVREVHFDPNAGELTTLISGGTGGGMGSQ